MAKDDVPAFSCKFVDAGDPDERNAILKRPPRTVEEWKESVNRCMEVVQSRLDEIERRILAGSRDGANDAEGGSGGV